MPSCPPPAPSSRNDVCNQQCSDGGSEAKHNQRPEEVKMLFYCKAPCMPQIIRAAPESCSVIGKVEEGDKRIPHVRAVFFKIVVTVFMLGRLLHWQLFFRVQCRRSNRVAVPDGARTPA